MPRCENPFTPSFGEVPVHLAGRRQALVDLERAFLSERRRPDLTTLVVGARGTGKTTLLSLAADSASAAGWVVATTTAMDGMLEDIEVQAHRAASHLVGPAGSVRVSSVGIPQLVDIAFERTDRVPGNWRSRMEDLLDVLAQQGTGLLITVDEVRSNLSEMVQLAAYYQHFVRDGRRVALLMAGLPHHISSLLGNEVVSFLRRAQLVRLGRVDDFEIASALRRTVVDGGRAIDDEGLERAVAAIEGFPFMMQLVGYHAWDIDPNNPAITVADVERGVATARKEWTARILDATYRELSAGDIDFLTAMLPDEGDSAIANIQTRMQRSSSQVSQYRKRLIEAGVIGERRRGVVGFDLPYFRAYLVDQLGWEA